MKDEQITFMNIIVAAYVRAVSQHPEVNRSIMNKQYYSRNNCTVSYTMLKDPQSAEDGETAVKIHFDLTDTIYDVRDRMSAAINANRGLEQKNFADKLARGVMVVPGLPTLVVGLVRLLDRYGLCPGALLDELPFHTGMYITNNASIGLHHVNHHIYNFGNTSLFFGMGTVERTVVHGQRGQAEDEASAAHWHHGRRARLLRRVLRGLLCYHVRRAERSRQFGGSARICSLRSPRRVPRAQAARDRSARRRCAGMMRSSARGSLATRAFLTPSSAAMEPISLYFVSANGFFTTIS